MSASTQAPTGHDRISRLLHWATAGAILAAFLVGWVMGELPRGGLRELGRNLHYSLGVLALGLGLLRLPWRLAHPGPAPLAGPAWQLQAAAWTHRVMLGLALAVPMAGLFDRWARGRVPVIFGMPLPAPFPVPGGRAWGEVHETLAWALAAFVVAHLVAVLWHAMVLRDGTLGRMWGGTGGSR